MEKGMKCILGGTVTWNGSAVEYYLDVLQLGVWVVVVYVCGLCWCVLGGCVARSGCTPLHLSF